MWPGGRVVANSDFLPVCQQTQNPTEGRWFFECHEPLAHEMESVCRPGGLVVFHGPDRTLDHEQLRHFDQAGEVSGVIRRLSERLALPIDAQDRGKLNFRGGLPSASSSSKPIAS
jgi:hypothetical protein